MYKYVFILFCKNSKLFKNKNTRNYFNTKIRFSNKSKFKNISVNKCCLIIRIRKHQKEVHKKIVKVILVKSILGITIKNSLEDPYKIAF